MFQANLQIKTVYHTKHKDYENDNITTLRIMHDIVTRLKEAFHIRTSTHQMCYRHFSTSEDIPMALERAQNRHTTSVWVSQPDCSDPRDQHYKIKGGTKRSQRKICFQSIIWLQQAKRFKQSSINCKVSSRIRRDLFIPNIVFHQPVLASVAPLLYYFNHQISYSSLKH